MKLRGLLLILVCLNIGAGLWWAFHTPPPPEPGPQPVPGVARLGLLSERSTPPPPVAAAVPGLCLSLGPFFEADAYRAALHALTPLVERIQLRELPRSELLGYRVYLPPSVNRESALALTKTLLARGVHDYYLVSAGPQKHSISLGMFRDLGNAERRRDQLKALGFAVVLEPRSDSGLQWWIDVVAAADFDWQTLLSAGVPMEARTVDCRGVEPPSPQALDTDADGQSPSAGPIR